MNSGTLSLETVTNKSNFQKKTIIVEWNIKHQKKNNLHLFETNLTEKKYVILVMLKNTINLVWNEKTQNQ